MEEIHYDLVMSIVPELITTIKFSNRSVEQPHRLFDFRFQNIFITSVDVMNEKDEVYTRAKEQIIKLIEMLDEELNSNKGN